MNMLTLRNRLKRNQIPKPANLPFTDRQFVAIVTPMFVERLLQMVVGLADTFVISYTGEASVSGVSLVNQFNNIFIFLSTALAAGGAVIISQYIGNHNNDMAGKAASQLLTAAAVFSLFLAAIALSLKEPLLHFLFGAVDDDVMEACLIYLSITGLSFPMLAIYDAGAALYRSLGETKTTMYVSIVSNLLNIAGNFIGVFVLKAGVAGVAWPTLISRSFSAVVITALCLRKQKSVHYSVKYIFHLDLSMLRRVLVVAVPNGLENGIFQFVKVAMSSIVSLFGTYQIAANGIAQTFWSLANAFGNSGGPAFTTVIGQCMGDDNEEAAEYYFHRLTKVLMFYSFFWNLIIAASMPGILHFYPISQKTRNLTILVVCIHNLGCFWLFPYWGALPCGLRAAGDIAYTVKISILSTVFVRLVLSYVLGVYLGMGLIGVVAAMMSDWVVRSVFFIARVRSGKWKNRKLI